MFIKLGELKVKLYYSKGACSLAPRITLNELGVPFDQVSVNLKTKETEKGEDYLKINPKGSVPAIQLDDGSVLTENTALHQFLAEKHHANALLPPPGEMKRYRILEWLSHISTDLHKSFGAFFNPEIPADLKEKIFKPLLMKKLKLVETHLKNNTYLMGNDYTLPDAYLYVITRWFPLVKLDTNEFPNLMRFSKKMEERPAVKKALVDEGFIPH